MSLAEPSLTVGLPPVPSFLFGTDRTKRTVARLLRRALMSFAEPSLTVGLPPVPSSFWNRSYEANRSPTVKEGFDVVR